MRQVLTFKQGVRLRLTAPAMAYVTASLDRLSERDDVRAVLDGDLMVTSGNDSRHAANSRHYRDEALDLRVHNIPATKRWWLREVLEDALNAPFGRTAFRVMYEGDGTPNAHYHVQVTKGTTFP